MVTRAVNAGLIISSGVEPTAALDELSASCGWPMVLQATPARLRQEFSWGVPRVSLVWLGHRGELAASVRLLGWLRAAHPGVRRLALAYRLADDDIEPAVRSAGVHLFLAVDGQVRAVADRLRLWMVPCCRSRARWSAPSGGRAGDGTSARALALRREGQPSALRRLGIPVVCDRPRISTRLLSHTK